MGVLFFEKEITPCDECGKMFYAVRFCKQMPGEYLQFYCDPCIRSFYPQPPDPDGGISVAA